MKYLDCTIARILAAAETRGYEPSFVFDGEELHGFESADQAAGIMTAEQDDCAMTLKHPHTGTQLTFKYDHAAGDFTRWTPHPHADSAMAYANQW